MMALLAAPFAGAAPSLADTANPQSVSVEAECPAATPGTAECLAIRRTDAATDGTASPQTYLGAYTPADLQSAYGLPSGTAGAGQTVAIVDAYDLPTAEADLAAYRSQFGLPACTTANGCFRKVNQNGSTSPYPAADSGWGGEIALDIDMVSAVCPLCKILLVEATDNSLYNLGLAVNRAVAMGAVAVSNSYGGPEWNGETGYDTYYNHPGVAITASTGDCGYNCAGSANVGYPAASPYVVAVGGTSLTVSATTRGWTETAWGNGYGGAGSGCDLYETKPTWQHDSGCPNRTQADVSAVADPATGVAVRLNSSWYIFGGTSAASPIIAATYALAGTPAAGTYPASYPYSDTADLNDAVGGNNDVTEHSCTVAYLCNGVAGYDGPTGLGTPKGINAFTDATKPGKPTSLVAVKADGAASLTWTAPSSNGGRTISGYTVTSTPDGKTCTTTGARGCSVSGLTDGKEYTFTVHATNAVGDGPESDASNKVIPSAPTVPGRPTGVTAAGGDRSAALTWTAPADNGGSAINGYTVTETEPDLEVVACVMSGATKCTVSGLANGTEYAFTVHASNAIGDGCESDSSNEVTPSTPTAPGKPTGVVATPGNGRAVVTWKAPADDGRSPITGYTVTETERGLGAVTCAAAGALSCTVSGLTNGIEYTFTVHAGNTVGDGPESDASNKVVPVAPALPGKPTSVVATGGSASVYVSWTAPVDNGGGAIVGYTVTSSPGSKTCTTTGALSCTVGGLTNGQPYTFTVRARSATGTGPASDPSAPVMPISGNTYHPITPVRLLDTRCGTGLTGRLAAGIPRTFQVAGRGAIPAGATAITGNATVVNTSAAASIYLGPSPISRPATSTINFNRGQVTNFGVTVALSSTGSMSVTYMATSGTADLILDVSGYFTPTTGGDTYHPLTPTRLLDTRVGNGLSGRLKANVPRTFTIRGRGGIPATARAVTANVTVVNETSAWAVYVGPAPVAKPAASTINFTKGQIAGNSLTVALSPTGTLSVTFMSGTGNTTDLVLDVTGYYTADATGAVYVPVSPVRLLDTRVNVGLTGKMPAATPRTFQVTGRGGIPSNATGITGVLSVFGQTNGWAVFVGPTPTARPTTSALNFLKGDMNANGVTVALAPGGPLSITYMSARGSTTDAVLDVTGYFMMPTAAPAPSASDVFDERALRYQNPDYLACTAAAAESMLNTISLSTSSAGMVWQQSTSYTRQETMMAYERAHMTMLASSPGSDPHGWRNALNYFGWGSIDAGVYRDSAYSSFDAAARAAVSALARFHKPVGILAAYGSHAQFITGYQVTGDDPRTGSMNFTIVGVDLTDPWEAAGHRDSWITLSDWRTGGQWVKFSAYLQTDSPYLDTIDNAVGYDQWYDRWVIVDPVK